MQKNVYVTCLNILHTALHLLNEDTYRPTYKTVQICSGSTRGRALKGELYAYETVQ